MVARIASTPMRARKAHEYLLMKIDVTNAQRKRVLAVRLAKTIAFDWTGGDGVSAIGGRIQDGGGGCGNSFQPTPRNLLVKEGFDDHTGPEEASKIKPIQPTMKTTPLLTLGALLGTCAFATAQETPQRPDRPERGQREVPAAVLEKFDTDKDGKLSQDERRAMQEARQAEMLKKYDADGDGKLSPDERKIMREEAMAKRAALLEKYDADKNGRLDPAEIKAAVDAGEEIPMMGGRGGPGGDREGGRRGPRDGGAPRPDAAPTPDAEPAAE